MGHEVHVIASNFPKAKEFEVIDGITIERCSCLIRPLRNPIAPGMLRLGKKIKEFDVIHTHNEHSFAAMAATYFRRKIDAPLILTCHGQLIFGNKIADYFERIYSRIIGRKIFKIVDHIITLSSSDKQYVSSFGIDLDKIGILPNAIDSEEMFKLNQNFENFDSDAFIQKYRLDGKRIILFVGPVIRRKGVEYLIKAIPTVLKDGRDDITFVLVGGGDFLDKTRQLIKMINMEDHVVLTGIISDHELIKFYKCADLFVLPSLSEGVPTSILEAMYFGLPVVATDIPGVKDHFKDVALLVPPKNEDRLAEAIIRLLDDKELTRRLSKTGGELVKSRYTWDAVAREYEKIYDVVINENRSNKGENNEYENMFCCI